MAELDTNNLFYVQTQTGIGTAEAVFTTDQLNIFYTLADSSVPETILMVLRAILADTAKLHDYRIASASESLAQVFSHVKSLVDYWTKEKAGEASTQVVIGSMRPVPPNQDRDEPYYGLSDYRGRRKPYGT